MKQYWDETYLKSQLASGKTYSDIARENNIGRSTVQRALHKYGLTKPSSDWSQADILLLTKSYGQLRSFKKLFPQRSWSAVYHNANRLGLDNHLKPRKYSVNETFFKTWNPAMAYVLGWLFSDGNVTSNRKTFRLKLSIKDLEIIKKIQKVLKTDVPIKILNYPVPSKKYIASYALLRINSYAMCHDLIQLGCVPRKTNKFSLPDAPVSLLRHFIRGYFDGDGSISFNKPNTIKIKFVGSNENFLFELASAIKKELNVPINHSKARPNLWQCLYYGDNARKICAWMYASCNTLYLKRKRKRFELHMKKRDTHV